MDHFSVSSNMINLNGCLFANVGICTTFGG